MPIIVVVFAVLNLAVGFVLAVYLGAAPRFASTLRMQKREPSGLVRRLLAFLPKKKPAA
jgi:hypothetical protein